MLTVRRAMVVRLLTFPVTALATLLTSGLIIRYAGAETYGQVMLMASVFALIPMADLGTGTAIVNSFADPQRTITQKTQVLKTVILWLIASATILIFIAVGGMTLWSWSETLRISGNTLLVDRIMAGCIILFALSVPFSIGQRMLVGLKKNEIMQWISGSTSVVALLASLLLWVLGLPGLAMALALPFGILFSQILSMYFGFKNFKVRFSAVFSVSATRSKEVFSTALPMLVLLTATPIALQGPRFIVAHSSEPLALSQYTMAMQIYTPLWSFLAAAAIALWPLFYSQRYLKDRQRKTAQGATIFFSSVGLFAGVSAAIAGDVVSSLVSDGEIRLDKFITVSVGLMIFVQAIQQIPGMFFTDSKGLTFQSICVILMMISAITSSFILTPQFGPGTPFACIALSIFIFQVIPGFILLKKRLVVDESVPSELSA